MKMKSINITVNREFDKNCRSDPLLEDPQYKRQEQEKQRRKLRLLQVREKSKNLAESIRKNVAAERKRCLSKLKAKTAEEMNIWRRNQLAQENEAYKSALSHVGQAHRAAREEKKQISQKPKPGGSYKQFKKTMRNSCKENKPTKTDKCICQQPKVCPAKESKCICTQTEVNNKPKGVGKNKPETNSFSLCADEDENYEEEEEEVQGIEENLCSDFTITSSSSSSDSMTSSSQNNYKNANKSGKSITSLSRTPAIVLDVEVGCEDTVEIMPSYEIKDKHIECNRQFNNVIRISPPKKQKEQQQQKQESEQKDKENDTVSKGTKSDTGPEVRSTTTNTPRDPTASHQSATVCTQTTLNTEKRFTIITNLLKEQQKQATTVDEPECRAKSPTIKQTGTSFTIIRSPRRNKSSVNGQPSNTNSPKKHCSRASSESPKRDKSPVVQEPSKISLARKYNSPASSQSPKRDKAHVSYQSSKVSLTRRQRSPARRLPNLITTQQSPRKRSATSTCSSSGKVQFYDYPSKTSKEYTPTSNEMVDRHQDYSKPTAMEDALKENIFQKKCQQDVLQQNKISEKRGQKALEREQIRRDCNELTDKLEALSRQYPRQMPNSDNAPRFFADKELRKETKMNAAIEELLNRPTIITCPEYNKNNNKVVNKSPKKKSNCLPNMLNLGAEPLPADDISTDSCCSILLGYVDDQSKKVRRDLDDNDTTENQEKSARLKDLLQRLDELRNNLLTELHRENNKEKSQKDENVQNIIKCINKLCGEHKTIVAGDKKKEQSQPSARIATKSGAREPVEIVITVKGDSHRVKMPGRVQKKTKRVLAKPASFIRGVQTKTPKNSPIRRIVTQNSYDSNSTSYRSLPKQIYNKLENLAEQLTSQQSQAALETDEFRESSQSPSDPTPRFNPLIAQYIQRLLGMSHAAVQTLGVSSSDIQTPNSTLMNTSANMGTTSEDVMSEERIISITKFLEENHSFIKELENTLQSHSYTSLDSSLENIWRKRLILGSKQIVKNTTNKQQKQKQKPNSSEGHKAGKRIETTETKTIAVIKHPEQANKPKEIKTRESRKTEKYNEREGILTSPGKLPNLKRTQSPQKATSKHMIDKAVETQCSDSSSNAETARKLTESCTHRIAELTELINRVREEKQRLLEVTLSSVSDNDRQSTEYLELPGEETEPKTTVNESGGIAKMKKPLDNKAKKTTLDKSHPITGSRDSGIHESRPATAQELHNDIEPDSHTSTEPLSTSLQRKAKPPPTIRRLSPQFIEDEGPHELSTIPEVDTPGTSRLHTGQSGQGNANTSQPLPVPFPTFPQYVQKLNLDVSRLNAEQKSVLEQDFCHYLELLYQSDPHYNKFPSMKSYMKALPGTEWEHCITISESTSSTTSEERFHVNNIVPQGFPSSCEYMLSIKSHTIENGNGNECPPSITDNDLPSFNVEEELKRRNIMTNSFKVATRKTKKVLSCTPHQDVNLESGLERLSTSRSTIDKLEASLKRLVMKWPEECHNKSKRQLALSNASDSTRQTSPRKEKISNASSSRTKSVSGMEQALNLRDFLTKELLKHANLSASTSTVSEDSLCSQFLHSIIGTLSPRTVGGIGRAAPRTVERHKTSTPILIVTNCSTSNTVSHDSTSQQMFSQESRISSVKLSSEGGGQADKSSSL